MPVYHFLLLLLPLTVLSEVHINKDVKLSTVSRQANIQTHIEEIVVQFAAENGGSKPIDYLLYVVAADKVKHLAFIQAYAIVDKAGEPLTIEPVKLSNSPAPEAQFYKITLLKPVGAGESVTIQVGSVFTNTLVASPPEIEQKDPQNVRWTDNIYIYSPYTSTTQASKVKLQSAKVVSRSPEEGTAVNGEEIDVGPFMDVAPFSQETLMIHSENNAAFATFITGLKEIEISHWGNVAVEEHYYLKHTGAKLKGSFSRYDYQRSQLGVASYRQINALLPASATDIYYRDRIGNISTSNVRASEEGVVVEVQPRFPMFGGWSIDFYWGYNLPASEVLFVDQDTGKYVLNMTFGSPFLQTNIEQWEVRVIFPEGANDFEWNVPFEIDSTGESKRVTYLDTVGRPVRIWKKTNVVRHHNQPLLVAYHFSKTALIREPFFLALAFLAFFFITFVAQRVSLTISNNVPKAPRASSVPVVQTAARRR